MLGLGLPEDVRVAADELLVDVLGDLREVPGPALLEQQREEVDLEEHVAELVEELGVVAGVGRVGQLVGLLDRVRDDRALVLLAVPGALPAQPPRQRVEARDRGGGVGLLPHAATSACSVVPRARRRLLARRAGPCVVEAFFFGAFLQSSVT